MRAFLLTLAVACSMPACTKASPSQELPHGPLIRNEYTADPTGRVFNGTLYVYTSHDLKGASYWDMTDWRLLSTQDLRAWKDEGSVFSLKGFSWAKALAWAPDCVQANNAYFLFLPVDRNAIGVAVGQSPAGPFQDALGHALIDNRLQPEAGPEPIDPSLLQDEDGSNYLFFGCRFGKVVKLDKSLTRLAGPITDLDLRTADGKPVPVAQPGKEPVSPCGYGEAPFAFKRQGTYYLMYSNGWNPKACLVYATARNPMGPYTYRGPVMPHVQGTTQHGSIVEFKGRWFVLYHTTELSGGCDFERSVCIAELKWTGDEMQALPPAP